MTEAEKKAIYDEAYVKSLDWHKHEFERYEHYLKIPLEQRWEIMFHIKAIWNIMARCGVHMYSDTSKPMSDVGDIQLQFKTEGDPSSMNEILISSHSSCWNAVKFEQTEEEIERAARSSAKMDVEMAEYREQKKKEEEEERKRLEAARAEEDKKEAEAEAKAKKEMEEWQAKENAKKAELEAWYDGVRSKLDKIRRGEIHWYADDHLSGPELDAVKNYASTLFAFTDAQNMGMTGLGLYAQNEYRAAAHESLLDVFGLFDSEHALHVTKSYDFSDDYDSRTQQYKHLSEDTVINMLGYALLEAKMHKTIKKGNE